ncbi:flagellar protein FliT [Virgibacillus oceani]|uniref:Flagellar protein FliT n=1 Tax=Virgibacillus oceani TaxID=1479511 RepID=A0A917LZQ1_9BACI|nr:flagellar protein FliT [Virgibacillus oceani]GGG67325.1 flagellar protein FliT [Virgibacillus oceani]
MNRLDSVYQITKQLEALLVQTISSKNRETVIGEINILIEKRGKLIKNATPPFNDDEKQTGEKLVEMNNAIQQKMDTLFAELKLEMKQIKRQKKSNKTYINPYEKVNTIDGMFMDSRK